MFHSEMISLRLRNELEEKLNKIIKENPEIYKNKSHFARCAIIKLINEHERATTIYKQRRFKE